MSDAIFIAVLLAFFVLCALYVQLCDRMIGPDDPATTDVSGSAMEDQFETAVATASGTRSGVTG